MSDNQRNAADNNEKSFFLFRAGGWFGKKILAWTGMQSSLALDMREKYPKGGFRAAIDKRSNLLGSNLHDEKRVSELPFDQVLAFWGIDSPEQLQRAISAKKWERGSGILISGLSGAFFLHQMIFVDQGLYWQTLHGIAMLSFFLLGLCLGLAAHWRIRVLTTGRFIPFLRWLNEGSSFPEATALLITSGLIFAAVSANAAGGLSVIPNVSVSQTDLSVQLLDKIFGPGWANLASSATGSGASGDDGPTLIYALLGNLNSACSIAVAWFTILTIFVGAVGAADEGKSLAGKHSSPWVPIRFAFSFAAIAPVFHGLSALQILILAGTGMSVDMANSMFLTGLQYIERKGVITAKAPPGVAQNARALAAGMVRSHGLQAYLALQVGCPTPENSEGKWMESGNKHIYLYNAPQDCGALGKTNLYPTDIGHIAFIKSDVGDAATNAKADHTRMQAIMKLATDVAPIADKIGYKTFTYEDYATIFGAAQAYAATIAANLGEEALAAEGKQIQLGMQDFMKTARANGWFAMGSYYWVLATTSAKVMDLMSDNASYSPPNLHAVNSAGILYTDWSTYAEPNLRELEKALISNETVKNMGKESIAQATGANESPWLSAFSGMSEVTAEYIAGFGKDRNPLLAYINAARHMLNAMDVMVITASLSKAGVKAVAGATFAAGNLLAGAANVLTGGALNASATAAASLLEDLFTVIMCVVVPLKAIFTFFAFIVPAIPLFCWIAAIVGWLVLTVEAVVAAPVWLVAHCMPEGEGFAGQHGRAGWTLFLSVLLRAPLLVLCMYLCMILIDASGSLISELFGAYLLASRSVSTTAQNFGLTASVALLIVLGTVIGLLTWKLFDLVTGLPDRILRWAGGLLQNLGDEGRGLAQQALGESRSSVENAAGMGRGVSKVLADRAEHNRKMRESQTGTGDARAKEEAEHGDHAIGSISKLREDDPLG